MIIPMCQSLGCSKQLWVNGAELLKHLPATAQAMIAPCSQKKSTQVTEILPFFTDCCYQGSQYQELQDSKTTRTSISCLQLLGVLFIHTFARKFGAKTVNNMYVFDQNLEVEAITGPASLYEASHSLHVNACVIAIVTKHKNTPYYLFFRS